MIKHDQEIVPRLLHFNFPQPNAKYWHSNCPIKTYHFNALAHFLPTLERLLVLSLKKSIPHIKDSHLKSSVASLIAQEAIHGREFCRYNAALITPHFQLSPQGHLRFFRVIAGLLHTLFPTFHCSLSAAGEHFTAIAADLFLRESKWFEGVEPPISAIWRWHCIEEIEHQSVAFDAFDALNGSYVQRVIGMIIMTIVFASLYFKPIWQMMKQDNKHRNFRFYQKAFKYYWSKGGLCRALLKPYFAYFKPKFHPRWHQNDYLIRQWKAFFKTASVAQMQSALVHAQPPS